MKFNEKETFGKKTSKDEARGTKSLCLLFKKIDEIIGSSLKVTRLSNVVDSDEKSKEKSLQKKRTT